MNAMFRVSVLTAIVAVTVIGASVDANAEQKIHPLGGVAPVPRLGFNSYFNGYGEAVTFVHWGSRASRIGLEPSDVIVAVNGYPLNYNGAWYAAMGQAAAVGHATLAIRDWRTGRIVYRHVHLGGPVITGKG
jgi:S1-C subfamily serine protease